ncbi:MAG: serine/threonine-protein phosphatase [Thermoleophilia bacterium]|nr:serine/threonine-protein phosphatase [Thermoleophilia bacterium]
MVSHFDSGKRFRPEQTTRLKMIAGRLAPHAEDIVSGWVERQLAYEASPNIPREKLASLFTTLFYDALEALRTGNIDRYLATQLPEFGRSLPESGFAYESLIISVHFLEESYLPYLTGIKSGAQPQTSDIDLILVIDEFWHFWMAELATAYFYEVRRSLTEESEIVKMIQEQIMPQVPEKIGCLEIATVYDSATKEARLGGDFYDMVDIDGIIQHFIISDFSGKGLRAASKAASIRAMFRGFAIEDNSPVVVARRLNHVLANELEDSEFDTAFLARFDQRTRTFRYVNAGHPGPVLVQGGEITVLPQGENAALGIIEEQHFSEKAIAIAPGSTLVMYTDGVIESRSEKNLFGIEGVVACVSDNRGKTASELAAALWHDCRNFGDGRVADDVAILVLKCQPE